MPRSASTSSGSIVAADSHCSSTSRPVSTTLVVVRHREQVDGLVVARVGVDVGAEPGTEAAQHVDQFVLGELLGAVEQHVFEEVGATVLGVVLEHRSGIDGQAQFDPAARIVVVADEVAQAVVEFADRDRRIGFAPAREGRSGSGAVIGVEPSTGCGAAVLAGASVAVGDRTSTSDVDEHAASNATTTAITAEIVAAADVEVTASRLRPGDRFGDASSHSGRSSRCPRSIRRSPAPRDARPPAFVGDLGDPSSRISSIDLGVRERAPGWHRRC